MPLEVRSRSGHFRPCGGGKIGCPLRMSSGFCLGDYFSFSFRVQEFAYPPVPHTLNLAQIPARSATLTSVLAGQERKSRAHRKCRTPPGEITRDPSADLLTLAVSDRTFRIILTCRDYSTDLVRAAFLRSGGRRPLSSTSSSPLRRRGVIAG